jgi:hypothetical protein
MGQIGVVLLIVAITAVMAVVTSFFAYFFDQLSIGGFRYLSSSFIRFVPELSLEYARLH